MCLFCSGLIHKVNFEAFAMFPHDLCFCFSFNICSIFLFFNGREKSMEKSKMVFESPNLTNMQLACHIEVTAKRFKRRFLVVS